MGRNYLARSACQVRTLVPVAMLLVALTMAGCAGSGAVKGASSFPSAPDVTFNMMDGTQTSLSQYQGKNVVLVNFWGLRCQNCIEEMPFLERLNNKYGSKGLVVLGVNTDGVDAAMLKKFLPRLPAKVTYPIVIDPDFALADTFQMMAAPLTILVAKDGTIRYKHEGYEESIEGTYIEKIEGMLAE